MTITQKYDVACDGCDVEIESEVPHPNGWINLDQLSGSVRTGEDELFMSLASKNFHDLDCLTTYLNSEGFQDEFIAIGANV